MAADENLDVHQPRYVYLADGRLLTWSHRPADDHTMHFRVNFDEWQGQRPISDDEGRQLLVEDHRQSNGRLLGPIIEPREMKCYRPNGSRRW